MESDRKNEQKKLPDRSRKCFKKSIFLLRKAPKKLTNEEMERLATMFEIAPRLADAYCVKKEFFETMRSENSKIGKKKLVDWLFQVELMEMEEFSPLRHSLSKLVPGDPKRHGLPLGKRFYRRLQQQNKGSETHLLRCVQLPSFQK